MSTSFITISFHYIPMCTCRDHVVVGVTRIIQNYLKERNHMPTSRSLQMICKQNVTMTNKIAQLMRLRFFLAGVFERRYLF